MCRLSCTPGPGRQGLSLKHIRYRLFFRSVKQRSWGIVYPRVGSSTVENVDIMKCLRGRTGALKSMVMFLFHFIFCVNCLIKTEELLMLKPLDFSLFHTWYFLRNVLGMKQWDLEQVLNHYCVWAESVAPTCLGALVTALLPQEERPHPASVLCFEPLIVSLDYVCLFWVLQSFSVLPVSWSPWNGMRGNFFHVGEQVLCKRLPRQRGESGF